MRPVPSGRWTLPAALSTALLVAGLMMPAAAETATVSTDIKRPPATWSSSISPGSR